MKTEISISRPSEVTGFERKNGYYRTKISQGEETAGPWDAHPCHRWKEITPKDYPMKRSSCDHPAAVGEDDSPKDESKGCPPV
jgi:hypothetical protein